MSRSPNEIKKGLEPCECKSDHTCVYCEFSGMCENEADALAYIKQLEAQVPKWISVEERLPEERQKVMVCGLRNGMQVGAFRGLSRSGRNRKWWWKKDTILEVTHWMPLPEPPKEGRYEDNHCDN